MIPISLTNALTPVVLSLLLLSTVNAWSTKEKSLRITVKVPGMKESSGHSFSSFRLNAKKSSKFDRILDDFIGKKFGAGEAFYGKRTSTLSDEEYAELTKDEKSKEEVAAEYENQPLKNNAILLVGEPEADVIQWIALELLEKGFNVRLAVQDQKRAIQELGQPGFNVDMVKLSTDSKFERYARAIQDVQAIIFCSNYYPFDSLLGSKSQKNFEIAEKIINLATKAKEAKVGSVQKIVHLSRYLPNLTSKKSNNPIDFLGEAGALVFNALWEGSETLRSDGYFFDKFRNSHKEFEQVIKKSTFDYVIVRAPASVLYARPGAKDNLGAVVGQELAPTEKQDLRIATLDLAEATVQSLLLENINNISFTPYSTEISSSSAVNPLPKVVSKKSTSSQGLYDGGVIARVPRDSYYSILRLDEETDIPQEAQADQESKEQRAAREAKNAEVFTAMRSTYMIRPPEQYRSQISEDKQVEEYWERLLKKLPKD